MSGLDEDRCTCSDCLGEDWDITESPYDDEDDQPWPEDAGPAITDITPTGRYL